MSVAAKIFFYSGSTYAAGQVQRMQRVHAQNMDILFRDLKERTQGYFHIGQYLSEIRSRVQAHVSGKNIKTGSTLQLILMYEYHLHLSSILILALNHSDLAPNASTDPA